MVVMTLPKQLEESTILTQRQLGDCVYLATFSAPEIAKLAKPGQFIQVRIQHGDVMLRRPFGVAAVDRDHQTITMIYRKIGHGTRILSEMLPGEEVNILGPLGHGFRTDVKHPLLIGGGVGLAPLLFYAAALKGKVDVIMGGRNEDEMFWVNLFRPYVKNVYVTTDDGSMGTKGFPTTILPQILEKEDYDSIAVCGPEIMMRGVAKIAKEHNVPCEVSLEKRMGCGLGACLSCAIDTTKGRKKVCKDGPVFPAEEVFA